MSQQEKDRLEIEYHTNPRNIQALCPLAEIYLAENRLERAGRLVDAALKEYGKLSHPTASVGLVVLDVALKLWKADRFTSRGNVRLNISMQRRKLLDDIHDLCENLMKLRDRDSYQSLTLKSAYVKEARGSYQDTLTVLSDLITMQATEGVDLSYIIFKAAILLRHVGHIKQSIEYLEFVFDDPPSQGLNRLHVAAFIVALYEISGEKYRVFLAKAYRDLITVISEEADPKINGASAKQYKRLENMTKNPTAFQSNAEFWEVVALQALERCEYVLAAEFLMVGIQKATTKAPMQHYLAEVLWLLGEKEPAEKAAEKAFAQLPQSADLRNLLLLIAPDKWSDRLRFLSPTKTENLMVSNIGDNAIQAPNLAHAVSSSALPSGQQATTSNSSNNNRPTSGASGLVNRLRNSAASALQAIHQSSFRGNSAGGNSNHELSPSNSRASSPERPMSSSHQHGATETIQEEEGQDMSKKQEPVVQDANNTSNTNKPSKSKQSKYDVKNFKPSSSPSNRGRRPIQGKPLKPPPIADPEEKRMLQLIQQGNSNIHIYVPELEVYSNIQRILKKEKDIAEQRAKVFAS